MVALPKSILEEIRLKNSPSKMFTYRDMQQQFSKHGYGANKIQKWFDYYTNLGIIVEKGTEQYTCIWWW